MTSDRDPRESALLARIQAATARQDTDVLEFLYEDLDALRAQIEEEQASQETEITVILGR